MNFAKLADSILNISAFKSVADFIPQTQTRDEKNRVILVDQDGISGVPVAITAAKKLLPNLNVQWTSQVTVSYIHFENADLNLKWIVCIDGIRHPVLNIDKLGIINNKPSLLKFYLK